MTPNARPLYDGTTLRRRYYLILVTTLFVLSYGSLTYMIVTNDRPFSGHVIVTPEPIEQAYTGTGAGPARGGPRPNPRGVTTSG